MKSAGVSAFFIVVAIVAIVRCPFYIQGIGISNNESAAISVLESLPEYSLPPAFEKGKIVEQDGYCFQRWEPGSDDLEKLGLDATELYWSCYAWPVEAGETGRRTFFIDNEGTLLQNPNKEGEYNGREKGPAPEAAFLFPDSLDWTEVQK